MKTYIRDDNKDIIEDNVRETNVRTFVEVTDIVKIVRKKNLFLDFTDENSQSRTCKECEKFFFLILQIKTHIRDNHAEY